MSLQWLSDIQYCGWNPRSNSVYSAFCQLIKFSKLRVSPENRNQKARLPKNFLIFKKPIQAFTFHCFYISTANKISTRRVSPKNFLILKIHVQHLFLDCWCQPSFWRSNLMKSKTYLTNYLEHPSGVMTQGKEIITTHKGAVNMWHSNSTSNSYASLQILVYFLMKTILKPHFNSCLKSS